MPRCFSREMKWPLFYISLRIEVRLTELPPTRSFRALATTHWPWIIGFNNNHSCHDEIHQINKVEGLKDFSFQRLWRFHYELPFERDHCCWGVLIWFRGMRMRCVILKYNEVMMKYPCIVKGCSCCYPTCEGQCGRSGQVSPRSSCRGSQPYHHNHHHHHHHHHHPLRSGLPRPINLLLRLIIYGHSMGTGIASHATAICQAEGHRVDMKWSKWLIIFYQKVDGIILDSPFHSMRFALTSSAFGRTLNYIFDLEQFMENIHLVFDTPKVKLQILLHCFATNFTNQLSSIWLPYLRCQCGSSTQLSTR